MLRFSSATQIKMTTMIGRDDQEDVGHADSMSSTRPPR